MTISSVGHTHHYAPAAVQRGSRSNHVSTTPTDARHSATVDAADHETKSKNTEAVSKQHDGPKGVLDLLQSGHFKGVAAVRLSINFHEQLNDLNQASARIQVEDAAASLDEQVTGALEVYPEGASEEQVQLVTEARETFSHAIRTAVEGFKSGETGRDDTLSGMQAAFDGLMSALEASFSATGLAADDSATDEPAADDMAGTLNTAMDAADEAPQATVEGVVEAADEVLDTAPAGTVDYLATIGQVFNSLMGELQAEMGAINAIPEFTAPQGNGAAFEKFMAIYRDLAGVEMPDDASVTPEAGVDAMLEEGIDLQI